MSRAYTTTDKVSQELNGFTIDTDSTPTTSTVERWIEEETEVIEKETNGMYGTASFDSTYDFNGRTEFRIKEVPIVNIGTAEYESNGIGADTEDWKTLTKGRTNDFIVYNDKGIIRFINNKPPKGYQNFRLQGVYGYETTPNTVQKLCTKLVARRLIESVIQGQSTEEGGAIKVDVIELEDPSSFSIDNLNRINDQIKNELYPAVGNLKSYRYVR